MYLFHHESLSIFTLLSNFNINCLYLINVHIIWRAAQIILQTECTDFSFFHSVPWLDGYSTLVLSAVSSQWALTVCQALCTALHVLTGWPLTTILWGGRYYHCHLTVEGVEAGEVSLSHASWIIQLAGEATEIDLWQTDFTFCIGKRKRWSSPVV